MAMSLRTPVGGALAAAGAWLLYSRLGVEHGMALAPALDAEQVRFGDAATGELNAYVDRRAKGRPLVLVHSVNAAASAYEVRPLFEHYRATRPVWALDLPGFGFSSRAAGEYTPERYVRAVLALVREQVREPCDVVALSLGAEFVARAALEDPHRFRSLALVSPTGFGPKGAAGARRQPERVRRVLASPLWAQAVYDLLVTRPSIGYFLQKSFVGPVDPGLADYAWRTAHRPGARHAPLAFVSGALFTPDVYETVYERLARPALVIHDEDPYTRFDRAERLAGRRLDWHLARIAPTRGLPHWERLPETVAALERFWSTVEGRLGAPAYRRNGSH